MNNREQLEKLAKRITKVGKLETLNIKWHGSKLHVEKFEGKLLKQEEIRSYVQYKSDALKNIGTKGRVYINLYSKVGFINGKRKNTLRFNLPGKKEKIL